MNEAERHALERLEEAVATLATHPGAIDVRLSEAIGLLTEVDVDGLTEAGARELFTFIRGEAADDDARVSVARAIVRVRDLLQELDVESDSAADRG
ncbi:MAG TPA: hypothetical protein VF698_11805 [Thermoanaerobaculia bacterium]